MRPKLLHFWEPKSGISPDKHMWELPGAYHYLIMIMMVCQCWQWLCDTATASFRVAFWHKYMRICWKIYTCYLRFSVQTWSLTRPNQLNRSSEVWSKVQKIDRTGPMVWFQVQEICLLNSTKLDRGITSCVTKWWTSHWAVETLQEWSHLYIWEVEHWSRILLQERWNLRREVGEDFMYCPCKMHVGERHLLM